MARSKSSNRWLQEHFDDEFVQRAKRDNYRSRAVYKLIELDERDRLLSKNMTVIELGAAPGGWTQYVVEKLNGTGHVIATDILPMDSFADVHFIQGDFTEDEVLKALLEAAGDLRADLVLSDMAPNLSGVAVTDLARAMYLAELALDLSQQLLKPGGSFVTKLFQGEGFDDYIRSLRACFRQVSVRKPSASRGRSKEVYAVAGNLIL